LADLESAKDQLAVFDMSVKGLIQQRNKAREERDNFEVQYAVVSQLNAQLTATVEDLKKKIPTPTPTPSAPAAK
jgi:hypothetical protein